MGAEQPVRLPDGGVPKKQFQKKILLSEKNARFLRLESLKPVYPT
jgi:hypothetical protein